MDKISSASQNKGKKLRDLVENDSIKLLEKLIFDTKLLTGEAFFKGLANAITEAIHVDFVLITECISPGGARVRTLAYAYQQKILDAIEYDLAETPCEIVMQNQEYCCSEGLHKKFKNKEGIESYYGIPIFGQAPAPLGHLAVMSTRYFKPSKSQQDILKIFSYRLGTEIIRKNYEYQLQQANQELFEVKEKLQQENICLREEIQQTHNFTEIVTQSKKFQKVLRQLEKVAPTRATVLITGETGTGKELLARAVHNLSDRKERTLIKVNCAALPPQLIESELFGHVKGAFTGAISDKQGKFDVANKSTLFLDEVGELPLDIQPKLLRALQEGEIERVGDIQPITVDVRVVAATNRRLEEEVKAGRFRADLFFRLNVFPLYSPPLRERKEDIEMLALHFIKKYAKYTGKVITSIDKKSLNQLISYHWPGNVRELENVIERAVILNSGPGLRIDGSYANASSLLSPIWNLQEREKEHITRALKHTQWKVSGQQGAAALLGLKPTTLEARMKKLNISRPV